MSSCPGPETVRQEVGAWLRGVPPPWALSLAQRPANTVAASMDTLWYPKQLLVNRLLGVFMFAFFLKDEEMWDQRGYLGWGVVLSF